MPNWKKVIVSGSDASLNSLTTPAGTINNITASYAMTASHALNGGVTQLLAGPNITLSPTTGKGQVTISSTGGGGPFFNTATGSYGSFYDTTTQTNPVANIPRSMSFNTTDITNGVSISGSSSPFNTYIKTENPGVYDIQFSAQLDKTDGGTDDIVIWLRKNGIDLTDTATTLTLPTNNSKVVAAWNWFVNSAANDYYQIIWYSADTDLRLLAETAGGGHPGIPSVIATVNRVDQFLSNTGSFSGSFTGTFTGSLQGTASFASTASFINVTGSNAFVQGGNSFGATALLGTNDTNSLAFETNGVTRMFVSSSGTVGVRTTNPEYTFDVSGSIRANGSFVFATDGAGGNGLSFVRNSSNNWTWGTSGIGNVMLIQGNSITLPQVVYSTNGLYVTPGGNSTSTALGVTVGAYPSATIASFTSGSVTALSISGSGMYGTGSFRYLGGISATSLTASRAYLSSSNGTGNGPTLTVYGSGSSQPVFTVQGSQGELFSITDSLSGSLYSVNDISGLPILEVFSDNTILMGSYIAPSLNTTTKITTTAGSNTIYTIPTASYNGAWFEYTAVSASNARAGSIMAIHNGGTVRFTETTTTDIGTTTGIAFTVIQTGGDIALTGSSATAGWVIKTIVRSI